MPPLSKREHCRRYARPSTMTAGKIKIVRLSAVLLAPAPWACGGYEVPRVHGGQTPLRVSGNIEVIEVGISFKIAGRVEKRLVDEGETVHRGQLIAELDTVDLEAEVAQRHAELQAAQAALAELEAGSRPEEIAAARAAAEKAAAVLAELKAGSRPQEIEAAKAQIDRRRGGTESLGSRLAPGRGPAAHQCRRQEGLRPGQGRL